MNELSSLEMIAARAKKNEMKEEVQRRIVPILYDVACAC